jgi:hypothetical protein
MHTYRDATTTTTNVEFPFILEKKKGKRVVTMLSKLNRSYRIIKMDRSRRKVRAIMDDGQEDSSIWMETWGFIGPGGGGHP